MKKIVKAVAVAGALAAPAVAFAQASTVQIYGQMYSGYDQVSASGATAGPGGPSPQYASRGRIPSNSALIGFRGSENLGGGLRAIWQVENQLSIDGVGGNNTQTMANGWNTRTTFVGMTGGFGQVLVGFLNPPRRQFGSMVALVPGSTGTLVANTLLSAVNIGAVFRPLNVATNTTTNTFGTGTGGLANNIGTIFRSQGVSYTTPTFNGFKAEIMYTPDESRDNTAVGAGQAQRAAKLWNLGLNYDRGPLRMKMSYAKLDDWTLQTRTSAQLTALGLTGADKTEQWMLGAGYALGGGTTVAGLFQRATLDLAQSGGLGDLSIRRDLWLLRARHDVGPHGFVASYARFGDNSVSGRALAANTTYGNSGADTFGLRYSYSFSKRTQVGVDYAELRNKANGNYFIGVSPMFPGGTGGGAGVVNAGADPRIISINLYHSY